MHSSPELDPELAALMDLEAAERAESMSPAWPVGGSAELDPELAQLMALEEAERTGRDPNQT